MIVGPDHGALSLIRAFPFQNSGGEVWVLRTGSSRPPQTLRNLTQSSQSPKPILSTFAPHLVCVEPPNWLLLIALLIHSVTQSLPPESPHLLQQTAQRSA